MIERPKGFLDPEKLDGHVFDYVRELHEYLWQVVRVVKPGASGRLTDHLDDAIDKLAALRSFVVAVSSTDDRSAAK